jgi:single-strand DNA-binding protein
MAMRLISARELKEKLDRSDPLKLVNALGDWEYRAAHIPGSLHFSTPEETLRELGRDDEIIVRCSNPLLYGQRRAATAALIHGRLRWLHCLPLGVWWHAAVSTVPRVQGQGRPPGQTVQEGRTMTEASVSFAGNLTDDPEVRYTESGIARAMFRVAVSGGRDQEASFFTVIVWRDQAEHAAQSLSRGGRVVVVGRLQQRAWAAEDGSARQVVEVVAEELGPSLTGAPWWRHLSRVPANPGAVGSSPPSLA